MYKLLNATENMRHKCVIFYHLAKGENSVKSKVYRSIFFPSGRCGEFWNFDWNFTKFY